DRPWYGSLYGGIGETITDVKLTTQHQIELQVGILGPGAGAQATQQYIHDDLHFSNHHPAGWHNQQRKNEPTIGLLYQQSRRYGSDSLDIVPEFGGMLGTVQTFVNAGATVRLGYHIMGFGVDPIKPTAAPTAAAVSNAGPAKKPFTWELYLFGGVDG